MTSSAAVVLPGDVQAPFAASVVEDVTRALAKAVRTRQLYMPNNPIYQRSIEGVTAAFRRLWQETDEITLVVTESDLRWEGTALANESPKAESLAWLLYKDGVRDLTMMRGVETEEILTLLDILQRVRNSSSVEDDLLTLLWEQEFFYLKYRFVDLAMDAAPEPEAGRDTTSAHPLPPPAEIEENEASRQTLVRMEDFDSTLYFLDEHEIEYLRKELQAEYADDKRVNVLFLLLDIFELQPGVRDEVCDILEQMILHLLSAGQLGAVALLLRDARSIADGRRELEPAHRERLLHFSDRLSVPENLSQLLRALNEATAIPEEEDLVALFEQLHHGSFATVLAWLGTIQNPKLRSRMDTAVMRVATVNVSEVVRLTLSSDPTVATEAIRLVGLVKSTAAVGALGKVLAAPAAQSRLAAAQALESIGSPGALRLLEKAIGDNDRDVRVTAIRALGAHGHRAVFARIESLVIGAAMKDADLTEKMALFEAYGLLGGEAGISGLDALLNGRGFLGRRKDSEVRACAAMALGKIGTGKAAEVLRKAREDKDFFVRNAVTKAIRESAT